MRLVKQASMHVIIVGAGLVGLTTAYALQKRGARVTVIERCETSGRETSFANAALMHPSLVEPWNSPGVGWDLLRWLGREDAPMQLHLSQLPDLALWGTRFLANSLRAQHHANTLKNLRLALLARSELAEIRSELDAGFCWKKTGVLSVSRSRKALDASRAEATRIAPLGINFRVLNRDETVATEPALRPVAHELAGSVHFTDDERGDAFLFCQALTEKLKAQGAEFHFNTQVSAFEHHGARITGLKSDRQFFTGDAYVLAAGSYSTLLARHLGINLPVRPAKGYSVTIRCKGNPDAPKMPMSDNGVHAAVTPIDDERVRIAGTAEFAGYDTTIRKPRIDYLMSLLRQIYPKLADTIRPEDITPWAGLRPMSCDGVPTTSRTRLRNLIINTGHGHIGWTTAAGSARLAADLLYECPPALNLRDYSMERF